MFSLTTKSLLRISISSENIFDISLDESMLLALIASITYPSCLRKIFAFSNKIFACAGWATSLGGLHRPVHRGTPRRCTSDNDAMRGRPSRRNGDFFLEPLDRPRLRGLDFPNAIGSAMRSRRLQGLVTTIIRPPNVAATPAWKTNTRGKVPTSFFCLQSSQCSRRTGYRP